MACRQALEPAAVGDERPRLRVPDGVVDLPSAQVPLRGLVEESSVSSVTNVPNVGITSVPSGESETSEVPVSSIRRLATPPRRIPWLKFRDGRNSANVARS